MSRGAAPQVLTCRGEGRAACPSNLGRERRQRIGCNGTRKGRWLQERRNRYSGGSRGTAQRAGDGLQRRRNGWRRGMGRRTGQPRSGALALHQRLPQFQAPRSATGAPTRRVRGRRQGAAAPARTSHGEPPPSRMPGGGHEERQKRRGVPWTWRIQGERLPAFGSWRPTRRQQGHGKGWRAPGTQKAPPGADGHWRGATAQVGPWSASGGRPRQPRHSAPATSSQSR
ncbi:hypothetical protein CYFUS_008564 [Cystobacter fuscus]|uniref:Uncharacterized protein n=1 Tax=Cystobacter fuscus TaxID=43 RepID=A0A250JGR7_9BACT|nr:hypothetical protein CYFUS_008564 [Cystobacter fuscus]